PACHALPHLRHDQRDREPERHPATRHPQREAMAGRDDDPAVGRAWNRRGTTRLPSREGARTDERPAFSTLPESGGSGTGVEGRVVCLFTPPRLHEVQQAKGHPLKVTASMLVTAGNSKTIGQALTTPSLRAASHGPGMSSRFAIRRVASVASISRTCVPTGLRLTYPAMADGGSPRRSSS